MTDKKKTEVNLEMCSGFFRIPTDDIIYNITVLASNEASTTKVVEKIIEVEKIVEVPVEKTSPPPPAPTLPTPTTATAPPTDDYFERCAKQYQHEISLIANEAKRGASGAVPAAQDLADMAQELTSALQVLKRGALCPASTSSSSEARLTPALERLSEKISRAQNLCPPASEPPPQKTAPATGSKTITRYLFNLDTVFQTIYELCTNETVKSHIQNARARAEEIFNKDAFYDAISPKVGGYPEDDGFLTVPMTDIYTALGAVCSDKAICNLLAKMDKQQASIFLDQFLPLEVPPTEEVTAAGDEDSSGDTLDFPASPTGDSLASLLSECLADLDRLIYQSSDREQSSAAAEDSDDFTTHIEDAMVIAASIHHDACRLNEGDAAAQGSSLGDKIIELDALAQTMTLQKTQRPELSYEESLAAGQDAAQRVRDEVAARIRRQAPPPSPSPNPPEAKPAPAAQGGEASQDDIDRLLAELG